MRAQLAALEPNAKYRPLYESALARQRADWLCGMNMTRLYTLLGRKPGYDGVLSVGRVQTPLLGLIVARDRAIADFRPVPYYVVGAEVRAGGGERFRAFWVPPDGAELDPEGRLLSREVAEAACQRLVGQEGRVTACTEDTRTEAPPLPYALADLQMDAGRRLSLSAKAVLDACQSLYETHRLMTYPRSDCAYLPEGHLAQATDVLTAIRHHAPALENMARGADRPRSTKAWNDKKVTAHHAIVPTPTLDWTQPPSREASAPSTSSSPALPRALLCATRVRADQDRARGRRRAPRGQGPRTVSAGGRRSTPTRRRGARPRRPRPTRTSKARPRCRISRRARR